MLARAAISLSLIAVASLLSAACGGDDDDTGDTGSSGGNPTATTAPSGGSEDVTIAISDNQFSPATATIGVNQEVIWEWSGANPHSVVGTYNGEQVQSLTLTGSGTFVHSFATPGTLEYQCGVHGAAMSGAITIQ